jgi:hypothetical protein
VADLGAGGGVEWGGAGPGGEPVAVGEAGDVADVGQDPGGAGRADAVEAHQPGAGSGDRLSQPAGQRLELAVESLHFSYQLDGELPTRPPGQVRWPHRREHRLGLQGGQVPGGAAGNKFGQQPVQPVQPVQRLSPGPGQFVAAIGEQPQHRQLFIDDQLPQAAGAQGHHYYGYLRLEARSRPGRAGVEVSGGVALTSAARGEVGVALTWRAPRRAP